MDSQDYAYDSDESDEGYGDDGGFESVLVRQRTQAEWQVCVPTAMELRGRLREHFSDHPLELRARLPEHFSDHPLSPPSLISDPLQRPPSHTRLLQVLDSTRCLSLAEAEVGAISELLCCPTDLAALLLRYFKWDREKLTNDYMADAQAGAPPDHPDQLHPNHPTPDPNHPTPTLTIRPRPQPQPDPDPNPNPNPTPTPTPAHPNHLPRAPRPHHLNHFKARGHRQNLL